MVRHARKGLAVTVAVVFNLTMIAAAGADSFCGAGRHLGAENDGPGQSWLCVPDRPLGFGSPGSHSGAGNVGAAVGAAGGIVGGAGLFLQGLSGLMQEGSCQAALGNMNTFVDNFNLQDGARLNALGLQRGSGAMEQRPLQDSCKWAEYYNWKRPLVWQAIALRKAAQNACSGYEDSNRPGANSPDRIWEGIERDLPIAMQRCQQYTAQQQHPPSQETPIRVSAPANSPAPIGQGAAQRPYAAVTAPVNPAQLVAQRREHCTELERQGQLSAVSCWGGFSDLAAQSGQPALAKWANEHAGWLSRNGVHGCQAQQTMPIAPGCNFDYPIALHGAQCQGPNVGWSIQTPGGGQACCVKRSLQCLQWELAQ